MAAPHLQLNPEDCSEIGLLILDYIKTHGLTFTEMAERVGISRAALRIVCFKEGNPGKKTIPKLAPILGKSEQELCRMVFENKLKQMYENNDDVVHLSLDTIDSYIKTLQKKFENLPKEQQPDQYDIYDHALKVVSSIPNRK
jgi:transcriptional regulator with XRE-family HTH domain